MAIHPKLAFAKRHLKVSFQTVPGWQDLRISFKIEDPCPGETVGGSGLASVGIAIGWGTVGGAELPPWESEWELADLANASSDGQSFEYRARVKGMSHVYIPHLVHHMGMLDRNHGLITEMKVIGGAPIVDGQSITEDTVLSRLSDPSLYPGRWNDPGFPLDFVGGKKHEFGIDVHFEEPPQGEVLEKLRAMLKGYDLLLSSFRDENGAIVDLVKQMAKVTPVFVANDNVMRAYSRQLLHDHRPCRDAVANMLMKAHATLAPIRKATITSRAMP